MSDGSELSRRARLVTAGLGFVLAWASCQSSRDNGREGGGAVAGAPGGAGGEAGAVASGGAGMGGTSPTGVAGGGTSGEGATGGSSPGGAGGVIGSGGAAGDGVGGAGGVKGECPRAYVAPGGAFGSAGACGETGQACCPGSAEGQCNQPSGNTYGTRFCDWSSGAPICMDCGGMNQPCCWLPNLPYPSKAYCRVGACDATTYPGICTDTCGRPFESCCPGMNCWATCTCGFPSSCAVCGDPDCLASTRCVCPA